MSETRAALRDRLTELGETEVEAPSRAFTTGLERQLLGTAGATGATLLALPARPRTTLAVVSATAAAIAAAVLVGALLSVFGRGSGSTPGLSLAAAVDTTVVLPGGQTVPGRPGLVLPNGSVVWTGTNGRAAAGTVLLGPGLRAVVNQGHLELLPAVASSAPGSPVGTPATGGAAGGAPALPPVVVPHVSTPTVPVTVPTPSASVTTPKGLPLPTLPTLPPLPNLLGLR